MAEYPFMQFYEAGIPLSVNTDNRTVSNTSCSREFELLADCCRMEEEQLMDVMHQIYKDSVEMSFADDDIKNELEKVRIF